MSEVLHVSKRKLHVDTDSSVLIKYLDLLSINSNYYCALKLAL